MLVHAQHWEDSERYSNVVLKIGFFNCGFVVFFCCELSGRGTRISGMSALCCSEIHKANISQVKEALKADALQLLNDLVLLIIGFGSLLFISIGNRRVKTNLLA